MRGSLNGTKFLPRLQRGGVNTVHNLLIARRRSVNVAIRKLISHIH
jgi:hypothetical protein